MMKITLMRMMINSIPVVGNVALLSGTIFFFASDPATASAGSTVAKRPMSIEIADCAVIKNRIGVKTGKSGAVVAVAGRIRIEYFREAVGEGLLRPESPACVEIAMAEKITIDIIGRSMEIIAMAIS